MNTAKSRILVAEDEEISATLMETWLSPFFDVTIATNGLQAKSLIETNDYLFLILDIHLPDLTGLDICEWIKSSPKPLKPNIVITSSDDSGDVIRHAYSLNVDDYILKPLASLLFVKRIKRLERDIKARFEMKSKKEQTKETLNTALAQAHEYGAALNLIARLNTINDIRMLGVEVTSFFKNKGYFSAIQFRGGVESTTVDIDSKECSENELRVFRLLHEQGRIYSFGRRIMFNDEKVSILIKNTPSIDSYEYGFLVDVAAKIVPAINDRFNALSNHITISQSIASLKTAIAMIGQSVIEMESDKRVMIETMISDISASFHTLELNEAQESFFLNLIDKNVTKQDVTEKFDALKDKLDECLIAINSTQTIKENTAEATAASDYQDIEFF